MSALGQKQTWTSEIVMSALCQQEVAPVIFLWSTQTGRQTVGHFEIF
jgi:hypothetical protein